MVKSNSPAGRSGFDLIVVGGGVQGVMIALEAARRGQRPLVVERDRAGTRTSRNWFRILHGGLRYLQTLDIARLHESVTERRWFLTHFPDLVRPMPFLMPLYGQGLKRPAAFRLALAALAMLSPRRNAGLPVSHRIGRGRVLDAAATASLYPDVVRAGLRGGAVWEDALAPDEGLLFEALLDWARASGAVILEHGEATALITAAGRVSGLVVRDRGTGRTVRHHAPVVVNATGPWSGQVAARLDRPLETLFNPALAFNLMIDRPAPCAVGLAVTPPSDSGPALFLYPNGTRTFAGTWHASWNDAPGDGNPEVPEPQIEAFLEALAQAAPALGARRRDVLAIHAGLQPVAEPGGRAVSHRDVIHDHAIAGGPDGLYSVVSIKFSTARRVAERVLSTISAARGDALPHYNPGTWRPTGPNCTEGPLQDIGPE